jgi:hypothetical protein
MVIALADLQLEDRGAMARRITNCRLTMEENKQAAQLSQ